jgi:hypothetical protein
MRVRLATRLHVFAKTVADDCFSGFEIAQPTARPVTHSMHQSIYGSHHIPTIPICAGKVLNAEELALLASVPALEIAAAELEKVHALLVDAQKEEAVEVAAALAAAHAAGAAEAGAAAAAAAVEAAARAEHAQAQV